MVRTVITTGLALAVTASVALLGGCSVAQSEPAPPRPFGEIASEERAVVVSVADTMIDLRTGQVRAMSTRSPHLPVGPIAVSVPITFGGEKKREIPGEEITVRLRSGRHELIIQEQGSPPFAVGEQVRVLHEKPHHITGESRTRVARPDEYESPSKVR